jgi:hypothetical protein
MMVFLLGRSYRAMIIRQSIACLDSIREFCLHVLYHQRYGTCRREVLDVGHLWAIRWTNCTEDPKCSAVLATLRLFEAYICGCKIVLLGTLSYGSITWKLFAGLATATL